MRPQSRSPPFLVIGLLVALSILGFYYWNASSRNQQIFNQLKETRSALTRVKTDASLEHSRLNVVDGEINNARDELSVCSSHGDKLQTKIGEVEGDLNSLRQQFDVARREHAARKDCLPSLKSCETSKQGAQEESGKCKDELTKLQAQKQIDDAKVANNQCITDCAEALAQQKRDFAQHVEKALGAEALQALVQSGFELPIDDHGKRVHVPVGGEHVHKEVDLANQNPQHPGPNLPDDIKNNLMNGLKFQSNRDRLALGKDGNDLPIDQQHQHDIENHRFPPDEPFMPEVKVPLGDAGLSLNKQIGKFPVDDGRQGADGNLPVPVDDRRQGADGNLPVPVDDRRQGADGNLPVPVDDRRQGADGNLPVPVDDRRQGADGNLPVPVDDRRQGADGNLPVPVDDRRQGASDQNSADDDDINIRQNQQQLDDVQGNAVKPNEGDNKKDIMQNIQEVDGVQGRDVNSKVLDNPQVNDVNEKKPNEDGDKSGEIDDHVEEKLKAFQEGFRKMKPKDDAEDVVGMDMNENNRPKINQRPIAGKDTVNAEQNAKMSNGNVHPMADRQRKKTHLSVPDEKSHIRNITNSTQKAELHPGHGRRLPDVIYIDKQNIGAVQQIPVPGQAVNFDDQSHKGVGGVVDNVARLKKMENPGQPAAPEKVVESNQSPDIESRGDINQEV